MSRFNREIHSASDPKRDHVSAMIPFEERMVFEALWPYKRQNRAEAEGVEGRTGKKTEKDWRGRTSKREETQKQENGDTGNTYREAENQQDKTKNRGRTRGRHRSIQRNRSSALAGHPSRLHLLNQKASQANKHGEELENKKEAAFASSRPVKFFLFPAFQIHFACYFAKVIYLPYYCCKHV
ncbi:PREDICTED: uncharacterized protein LOC105123771 [Populus euphratica]|uniref:Uncharacterized protein LOC105123771 n=1 Tax=Populus euphratica TaxID=75702 RepID=A0AAJ6XKA1_POPEU|nr:PREDICTED: uncharacterized protein LOC105123771 [Populus euphratica]